MIENWVSGTWLKFCSQMKLINVYKNYSKDIVLITFVRFAWFHQAWNCSSSDMRGFEIVTRFLPNTYAQLPSINEEILYGGEYVPYTLYERNMIERSGIQFRKYHTWYAKSANSYCYTNATCFDSVLSEQRIDRFFANTALLPKFTRKVLRFVRIASWSIRRSRRGGQGPFLELIRT